MDTEVGKAVLPGGKSTLVLLCELAASHRRPDIDPASPHGPPAFTDPKDGPPIPGQVYTGGGGRNYEGLHATPARKQKTLSNQPYHRPTHINTVLPLYI